MIRRIVLSARPTALGLLHFLCVLCALLPVVVLAGVSASGWQLDYPTPLMRAAQDGNAVKVRDFLDKGHDVAVKALRLAADQGASIFSIDGGNIEQILPLLSVDSEDVATIRNAVNAGMRVTAASGTVLIGQWRGIGYIVHDPARGDGFYLISGGLAGGVTITPEEWHRHVYNNYQTNLLVRRLVFGKAKEWIGTPYGWGCKDPVLEPVCKLGTAGFWIDCSGLVASAYNRVGYPYLSGPKMNAQAQWNYIAGAGRHPSLATVDGGDMIFWFGTNTRLRPLKVDHVGIVTTPSADLNTLRYIAADGSANIVWEFTVRELGPVYVNKFHGFGSVLGDLPPGAL